MSVVVRMTSSLFEHARHYGVLIPAQGEAVEFAGATAEAAAESLIASGHAEAVEPEVEPAPAPDPDPAPTPAPDPSPAPADAEPAKRGPGRPRKEQ